jgi:NADPH:quinone reductase-like Zn-dependent oxidoreductase
MRAFMRAFQFMRLEGIPRQVPGVGEVLVAVKAAGATLRVAAKRAEREVP